MAKTSAVANVNASAWTQADSSPMSGRTIVEIGNKDTSQGLGVIIGTADPGAGVAWNAHIVIGPGGEKMLRALAADQVWLRSQTGAMSTPVGFYEG